MGMIINIDTALDNRTDYNILREPINDMLQKTQEAWERQNPIDMLFTRGKIDKFLETYTSSIGFGQAFTETNDNAVAPIFNNHEGFSKVYTSRTFQGGFMITQQVLEDQAYSTVKDTANQFLKRWHGDIVEYAMTAISSGFGKAVNFGDGSLGPVSHLKLTSADTSDGDIHNETKNPLFYKKHTTVKTETRSAIEQSNVYSVDAGSGKYGIDLIGDDPAKIVKLADIINQVITFMENYKDDNGKYAGVLGAKTIVAPNDARLKAAIETALETDQFPKYGMNGAYKRATLETTPYLRDLACCFDSTNQKGVGFFIVDKAYNAANHGPEFTERVALTMNVEQKKNPYGISYDARQRFDINVASWRGIAFVYIGNSDYYTSNSFANDTLANYFTKLTPVDTIVKPVSVVSSSTNPIYTDEVS